jgi:uncharacterized protein YjbJ (UPF0337 family)
MPDLLDPKQSGDRVDRPRTKGTVVNKDQLKGKVKQGEGKAQEAWGDTKEKADDLWDDAKRKASDRDKDDDESAERAPQPGSTPDR